MLSPSAPHLKYTVDLQVEHLGQQCVQLLRVSGGDPCEAALADFLCQILLVVSSERRSKPGPKDTNVTTTHILYKSAMYKSRSESEGETYDRAQSSYSKQPRDQMSDFSLYDIWFICSWKTNSDIILGNFWSYNGCGTNTDTYACLILLNS